LSRGRGIRRQARFQEGLIEAELLGLFERVGAQAHRAIFAKDLAILRLVQMFELEQFLRDDHRALSVIAISLEGRSHDPARIVNIDPDSARPSQATTLIAKPIFSAGRRSIVT
jgi:hypothetical protein